jgi:hypothetical protein
MIAVCNTRKNDIPSGFGLPWRANARRATENDFLVGDFCQPSTRGSRQQSAKNSFFDE